MAKRFKVLLISALCSCTTQTNWTYETLNGELDSSRLTFVSNESYPPILFEILKIDEKIKAFISLQQFHFTSKKEVVVEIQIGETSFEDRVPVHEGGMRICLHPETTDRIIQTLQDGSKVVIAVDGFEETLDGTYFTKSFLNF